MIRHYRPEDFDAVSRVCLLTGDAGQDATGLHSSDELIPDTWVRPYLRFEPDLAWVVDDAGVDGYLVATADSRAFALLHDTGPLVPEVDEYPAHLHINLLPRLQGRGLGRELIGVLVAELERRGIRGLHLGVDPANTGAIAFYERLGFAALPSSEPESPVMGLRLG